MENILGVGSITIADLNDALISGDAPRNPDEGALWIDSSANTPVLKVYKNGSWQPQEIDVNNLDPELSETVTTIVNTLGTLANDGLLTYTDRLQLSVEIASIIGQIPSKQNGNVYPNTLPAYNTIDSLGVGSFSNLRQTARDATVPTDNTYYIALEQAYTALNTYLSSLTPRPWDVTTTNKDKNTEVANPDTYRETLLNYYLAEMNLATYTEKRASDAAKEYTDASVQDAITSVDVEYATSTESNTVPDDDKWDTLAPTWSDGIFIWSRTLTTYKNGSSIISEPVNITGAKGESGGTGVAGRSITKIQEQYYVSDSATERIGGEWENEYPGWEEGKFVWTRSVITFTNPSGTHTTDPISVSGAKGDKGDPGANAPTIKLSGASQMIKQDALGDVTPSESFNVIGVTVNTSITRWLFSVNGGAFGTVLPTGVTRSGNVVTVNPNDVTFNTLSIRAEDGTVTDTFTIGRAVDGEKGAKGDTGSPGGKGSDGKDGADAYTVLLSNESHTFQAGTTNAIAGSTTTDIHAYKGTQRIPVSVGSITGVPSGMNNPSISNNNSINARITFSVTTAMTSPNGSITINLTVDGKPMVKVFSYSLTFKGVKGDTGDEGPQGPQGATGEQGPRGATGTSVESVTEYYLATSASSGIVSTDTRFTTTMQSMTATNKYLWNFEKINFSDGTSQPTIPVIIGVYGDKGQTGSTGATGRSIVSITEHYLATSANSGVTRSTSGWSTSMQPTTETERYLWNYETINWSSGTTPTYVEPIIIGVHGAKGDQGPRGVSITKVDVEYAQSTSSTTAPTTGWSTNAPTWKDNQYIWSRTVTTYSSGDPTYSKPAAITGQKGSTGAPGSPGATGTGITSISEEYAISTSKTTAPASSSFSATRPDWSIGQYIWTRSKIVYKNPTSTSYTTPVVSSEWEAINDLEIGGRNLLRDSGEEVSNGSYNIARYDLTDEIKENEEVTLTIWGELASTKSNFRAYNSGGSVSVATLTDNGDGTYSSTFKWKIGTSNNTYLNVYAFTSAQTGISTINKIKLEKGNIATDWTEAPEDTQAKIDEKAGSEYVSTTLKYYNAGIVEEIDKIVGTVQEDTVTKTEFGTYQQSLETKFTQDAKSYTMDFNNVTSSVQTLEGAVQEEFDEVKKYIRFIDGKIILGEVGNQITLEISKEKISFLQGEDEVAKLTNNELEITDARIKHELRIGDYAFKPRANGSVDFG